MNRKEFLEILRDYLKKGFSEDEINDIIRDYEEYFVDGELEGKSDLETISSLGSPKSIAKELIDQINKEERYKINNKKDKINDMYVNIKIKFKETFANSKDFIDEKLTVNLQGSGDLSSKSIKVILFLLSLLLILPSAIFIGIMLCMAGFLTFTLIGFFVAIPIMISLSWTQPEIALFFIFLSLAFIGFQILAWQIFLFIMRYMNTLYKKYKNWIKTRKIYINADKLKKEMDIEKSNKGGENNE